MSTLSQAICRVDEEINKFTKHGHTYRIDPDSIIISTNLSVRLDGKPRSGQRIPQDPGVAVYFTLDAKSQCIAVDTYTKIEQNLAAVAAVLSAFRSLERHGSGLMESAFTGFTALPDPSSVSTASWRQVLDYDGNLHSEAKAAWKRARSAVHADNGGSNEQFHAVNQAWEQAEIEIKSQ